MHPTDSDAAPETSTHSPTPATPQQADLWTDLRGLAVAAVDVLRDAYYRDARFRRAADKLLKPGSTAASPPSPPPPPPPPAAAQSHPVALSAEPARPVRERATHFDAKLVCARARLKARAARWQYEREKLDRDTVQRGDIEIIEAAKAMPDAFLWMCKVGACRTRLPESMDRLADAYEALADAAEAVGSFDFATSDEGEEEADADLPNANAVQLLAEAQSMLHVMLGRTRIGGSADPDQMAAFIASREVGRRGRHYFNHLALDDAADPARAGELRERIRDHRSGKSPLSDERRREHNLVGKVRYAVGKLLDGHGDETDIDLSNPHFTAVATAIEELSQLGHEPTQPDLRDALVPLVDRLPDDLDEQYVSDTMLQAIEAIDEFLADPPADDSRSEDAAA